MRRCVIVSRMKLLVVEDDPTLQATLERTLTRRGFTVAAVGDGLVALQRWAATPPDAVVLDLSLPGLDGLQVLAQARAQGLGAPVLILTARGAVGDRVLGLNAGADDYLAKPFDLDELEARLRALLGRAAGRASPTIRHGDIEMDPAARTVHQGGRLMEMSPREFSVLLVLLEARGRVLSRQQIEERLYSWDAAIESNAVEVHIHHLRRKLGSASIQTMRGVGYFMPQEAAA